MSETSDPCHFSTFIAATIVKCVTFQGQKFNVDEMHLCVVNPAKLKIDYENGLRCTGVK